MAEVSFAQIEPNPLNRVELGAVGWQQHERPVLRHVQVVGDVPPGLVHDHDGMLAWRNGCGKPVKEQLHCCGVQLRQHQGERGAGLWLHRREQVRPGVALVTQAWRSLAADEPAVAGAALLAEPCFVLKPQRQAAAWMRRGDAVQLVLKPPFDQAWQAAGSALGCDGRAFCRDRPSFRISLDLCDVW